jgi:arylsulfatase A-like enzyme
MNVRGSAALWKAILVVLVGGAGFSISAQSKPNIIYIMSDDHDADAISIYNKALVKTPNIDRLANGGMRFTKAFVGNSICSPSRATLLSGQHSHANGIKDNRTPWDTARKHLCHIMHDAGYETALIGKWHLHSLPRGFDHWRILPGQGLYYNPKWIDMQGDTTEVKGYVTDITSDMAIDWIHKQRNKSKPFLMLLHHKAPHRNFYPKLKFLRQTSAVKYPEPSTLYADHTPRGAAWIAQRMTIAHDMTLVSDLKVDPRMISSVKGMKITDEMIREYDYFMNRVPDADRAEMKKIYESRAQDVKFYYRDTAMMLRLKYQWYMQDYIACVMAVDESVGAVLNHLVENSLQDHTVVMYTSDQGFYLGENGWFDKRWMYDVSMQTPLIIRYPGVIKSGAVSSVLVQNIDNAPTILGLAGVPIPADMHGVNLVPILTSEAKKLDRTSLYYHYYEYPVDHAVMPHIGIRTDDHKLIYFYTIDRWELYDLCKDPNESQNVYGELKYERIQKTMMDELIKAREKYNDREKAGTMK